MIVFDVEIKKAILGRGEEPRPGIEYCGGWRDFKGMGVACVCTFDTDSHLTRVFLQNQLADLQLYLLSDVTGGFNTRRFDIPLLEENGVKVPYVAHFDALEEIWRLCGLDPDNFVPSTHGGWSLDAIMQATFGLAKSGHGALAPVWWQTGARGKVVDYCCRDAWLEAKLIVHMLAGLPVKAAGKQDVVYRDLKAPDVARWPTKTTEVGL